MNQINFVHRLVTFIALLTVTLGGALVCAKESCAERLQEETSKDYTFWTTRLEAAGLEYELVTHAINNPVILHFFGPSKLQHSFRITGGKGWLAEAAKDLENSLNVELHIDTEATSSEHALFALTTTGGSIRLSINALEKAYPGVLAHEKVHAMNAQEHLSSFRPEYSIAFVSPRGQMKVGGYENYMSSDEYEAFSAGVRQDLSRAREEFQNTNYEMAFKYSASAETSLLYTSIYQNVILELTETKDYLLKQDFMFEAINDKWLSVERKSNQEKDIKTIFRVNTQLSQKELLSEVLLQIEARLESLKRAEADVASLREEFNSFTAEFYPELLKSRQKKSN